MRELQSSTQNCRQPKLALKSNNELSQTEDRIAWKIPTGIGGPSFYTLAPLFGSTFEVDICTILGVLLLPRVILRSQRVYVEGERERESLENLSIMHCEVAAGRWRKRSTSESNRNLHTQKVSLSSLLLLSSVRTVLVLTTIQQMIMIVATLSSSSCSSSSCPSDRPFLPWLSATRIASLYHVTFHASRSHLEHDLYCTAHAAPLMTESACLCLAKSPTNPVVQNRAEFKPSCPSGGEPSPPQRMQEENPRADKNNCI